MRMRDKTDNKAKGSIIIRKEEVVEGGHHGGSWKVAYADFVTAMMAFFLLMWLLNATTEEQRKGLADYFSPNSVLSHNSSGTGQPFGGRTAFSRGRDAVGSRQSAGDGRPAACGRSRRGRRVGRHRPAAAASRRHARARSPTWEAGRRRSRHRSRCGTPLRPGPVPVAATTAGRGDVQRKPTEAELQAALEKREKQAFEQAAQQIRDAVGNDPQLAELARQLAIDMTPEGLRIQIRDADREPMFPLGSAVPNDKARLLLQKVAPVLARLTQDISIAGHTDAAPFAGPGRTNWELSADRANATRRLLIESGLQEPRIRSVTGNAERDLAVPGDPLAAANRRIAIVVLRSVRPLPEAP